MVLDATLLNSHHLRYRSRVKWSNLGNGEHLPLHLGIVAIEKGPFRSPSTKVTNFFLINKYGANENPYKIPVTMLKISVSPSGMQTIAFVFLQSIIKVVIFSLGRAYASSICSIFPQCIESNSLEKSMKNTVVLRFFAHTLLMIPFLKLKPSPTILF